MVLNKDLQAPLDVKQCPRMQSYHPPSVLCTVVRVVLVASGGSVAKDYGEDGGYCAGLKRA